MKSVVVKSDSVGVPCAWCALAPVEMSPLQGFSRVKPMPVLTSRPRPGLPFARPPGLRIPTHLPLSALVNGYLQFPTEGRYLIVCAHGVRSLSVTEQLRAQGLMDVYSLRGGLAALRS